MKEMNHDAVSNLDRLKKKALFFVWVGEIWNLLEAVVALWSGIGAVALELAAGAISIWRLQQSGTITMKKLR